MVVVGGRRRRGEGWVDRERREEKAGCTVKGEEKGWLGGRNGRRKFVSEER